MDIFVWRDSRVNMAPSLLDQFEILKNISYMIIWSTVLYKNYNNKQTLGGTEIFLINYHQSIFQI